MSHRSKRSKNVWPIAKCHTKKKLGIFVDGKGRNKSNFLGNSVSEQFPSDRLLAWGEAFKMVNEP